MPTYQGEFARAASALGAPGAVLSSELAAIEELVAEFEVREARMQWFEEAGLAVDVRELYGRIAALPVSAASEGLQSCLARLYSTLAERAAPFHARERAYIREGKFRGAELLSWLAAHPESRRDLAFESLLGIAHPPLGTANLRSELIDYVPGGIASVVRCVLDAPITADDEFLDVGAGVGKALLAVRLVSGARVRGIEIRPELCRQARSVAADLGLDGVEIVEGDACEADLGEPSVVFLYLPFTGRVLGNVIERLREVAGRKPLVICALGFDLPVDWLVARRTADFWLSIYDSRVAGVAPRPRRGLSGG